MKVFVAIRPGDVDRAAEFIVREYSPNIEIVDEDTLVFDLAGRQAERVDDCLRRLTSEFPGLSAGVSDNLSSALLLVGERKGISISGRGGALSGLGIDALDAGREFTQLMHDWGIDDLGVFAELPEDEMADRFGQDAVRYFQKARGGEFRASAWNFKENEFRWLHTLDTEIKNVEPLKFMVSTGVRKVFEKLKRSCLGSQECFVRLGGGEGDRTYEIRTIVPTLNERLWLRLIHLRFDTEPPEFFVGDIEVEFTPARLRTIQSDLFSANILEPEQIGLVASKIKKLVGDGNVGVPKLIDSWEPGSFALEEDLTSLSGRHVGGATAGEIFPGRIFFYFPDLIRVKVFFDGSAPAFLIMKGKRYRIVSSGGPWRVDGGWWVDGPWHRDEWDVETDSGNLFRMCLGRDGEYYLEGGYD